MEQFSKEVKYLTGMRGVAVLLVLFAHTLAGHTFNRPIAYLGMSLFFFLSGTVLTYTWASRFYLAKAQFLIFMRVFFSFIWARFARLAPLYFIIAVPYFASSVAPWDEVAQLIPRYLLGMQSWIYDVNSNGVIKQLQVYAISWSISSELWLYLLFPAFILFLYKRLQRMQWVMIVGIYLFYFLGLLYLANKGIYTGPGYPPSQTQIDWFVYLSPYGRIIEFLMGMLIGAVLTSRSAINNQNKKRSFHGAIALFILLMMVVYLSMQEAAQIFHPTVSLLKMGPLFTLPLAYLLLALATGKDITEKIFSTRFLVTVGTWSYSIYLLQGYGIPFFGQSWGAGISEIVRHITNFMLIMLLSAGSYQLIEVPARRFLLRWDPMHWKEFIWKQREPVSQSLP